MLCASPLTFTSSDKLYIKIMLKINFNGVNSPSKGIISYLSPLV